MIRRLALLAAIVATCGLASAGEIATGRLDIVGLSLEVEHDAVTTGVDIPSNVQTIFGGKKNDEAPSIAGLSVVGELTGPGILTPVTLITTPGHTFSIPALHDKGEYALQNIRLVGANGEFLQQAIPSFAVIRVTDVLQTEVRVRQLTADELRARGITVDARNFDVFGRVLSAIEPGNHATIVDYGEGNVTTRRSGEGASIQRLDGRGLLTEEVLPDGSTRRFTYDALGNVRTRRDEEQKTTAYGVDDLGRPQKTSYPDETNEAVLYEPLTGRIQARRDRTRLWLWFDYDAGGRVTTISTAGRSDEPGQRTAIIRYTYDTAGRLAEVRNADVARVYLQFDRLGRPGLTRQIRFKNGSGLSDAPQPLDVHTQGFVWSLFDGERTRWRMPVAGTMLPSAESPTSWQTWINEKRQSGDLVQQTSDTGQVLGESVFRAPGRLAFRDRGSSLVSTFDYDDANGLLQRVETESGPTLVGNEIRRTLSRRIAADLDLSLGRAAATFDYDDRERLSGTDRIAEGLTGADFRRSRTNLQMYFADAADARLAGVPVDWTATQTDAHQLDTREVAGESHAYEFTGGRRTKSDDWTLEYDNLGRLVRAVLPAQRRVDYVYDPNGRVVGRTVHEWLNGAWAIEDRAKALARDGVPSDVTFYWDEVTDRLLAIFEAGASLATDAPPGAGLLRQYVHGDAAYDDPLRVQTAGKTYFPILDEAGTGSLQAVLAEDGTLVERVLYADAYGDAPRYLQGPVVDRIKFTAKTNATGGLTSATVHVHLSERIDPATVATGALLNGIAATLADPYTLRWTLSALTTDLELTLTAHLRALGWGNTPVMPPPAWATALQRGVDSSLPSTRFRKRESLTALTAFVASLGANEEGARSLYSIPDLYLAASLSSKSQLLFEFKAWPFRDPATGFVYARARWYDAETGTFLTSDPMGYQDSSNLYSFGGGDPINNSDPTGELCERANTSGPWDWTKRCAQDINWFAQAAGESIDPLNTGNNLKRAAGGVKSTAKLVGGAVRTVFWDLPTASFNDAAADRLVAAGQGVGRFVAHPIRTTINAHVEMADVVLRHEVRREYVASGEVAAAQAQTDFLVAYSAYGLAKVAWSRLNPIIAIEGNPMAVDRLAEAYAELSGEGAGGVPGIRVPAVASSLPAYRYVGEGEASYIRNTGRVPNTTFAGKLKNVSYTPKLIESSVEAESRLRIGRLNPAGPTSSPVWGVEVDLSGYRLTYAGNSELGVNGIELQTPQVVPAIRLFRLKP